MAGSLAKQDTRQNIRARIDSGTFFIYRCCALSYVSILPTWACPHEKDIPALPMISRLSMLKNDPAKS